MEFVVWQKSGTGQIQYDILQSCLGFYFILYFRWVSLALWGHALNWLVNSISCKLGSRVTIDFWNSRWIVPSPLKDLYPNMFVFVENYRLLIDLEDEWKNGLWCWNLRFNPQLSATTIFEREDLFNINPRFSVYQ